MKRNLVRLLVLALVLLSPFVFASDVRVPVYGKPGDGRIRVWVTGNFDKPGLYWLEAGTRLPELVKRAQVNFKRKGDFASPPVILITRKRDGVLEKTRYWTSWQHDRLILHAKAEEFTLEAEDEVKTDYLNF